MPGIKFYIIKMKNYIKQLLQINGHVGRFKSRQVHNHRHPYGRIQH